MGAFLAELRADLRSSAPWVLCMTLALVVSVAGPFGSYGAMPLTQRVLFWTPIIFLAVLIGSVIRAFVYAGLGMRGRVSGSILITALNTAVLCPLMYGLINSFFPRQLSLMGGFFEIVLLVSSLSLGVCALRVSAVPDVGETPTPAVAAAVAPAQAEPRLARRLDLDKRGEIWAISVRDHYVDVHTSLGKSSLLMRFSDAIHEVDCVPGAQVHRSHWVAWDGVGSVCREGGKMILHLRNGHQIPASRNNREKVDGRFPTLETDALNETKGAA